MSVEVATAGMHLFETGTGQGFGTKRKVTDVDVNHALQGIQQVRGNASERITTDLE